MKLLEKLENNYLLVLVIVVVAFFLYKFILYQYLSISNLILTILLFFSVYFFFGNDKYERKYKECKIIGNSINASYLPHRIKNISHIIPNHNLIFGGGYVDIGSENLGDEFALIIDSSYYNKYLNGCAFIHPNVVFVEVNLSNDSKYNEIMNIISHEVGSVKRVIVASPQSFEKNFKAKSLQNREITISNLGIFLTQLFKENEELSLLLDGKFNKVRSWAKKSKDIHSDRKSFFKKKDNEGD